jgi:hypothetical protein
MPVVFCEGWVCEAPVEEPIPAGEACQFGGNGDPCELGHICLHGFPGPGTCELLCTGTREDPQCPPGLECSREDFANEVYVCLPVE